MLHQRLRAMGLSISAPALAGVDVREPALNRPDPAKPGWEMFLVATKRVGDPWPTTKRAAIALARDRVDAGTHLMTSCTTPNGWTQLYCRPRRVPTAPIPFFERASQT